MEKEVLEYLDSRRDIKCTVDEYKQILSTTFGPRHINSTTLFLNVVSRFPSIFNLESRYWLLKYLLENLTDGLFNLGDTDSLKENKYPLKWSRSFIDLFKFRLPNVRAVEHKGEIKMMDDVSLAQLIYSYVHALPKYLYTPVKKFVYYNLEPVYVELFKSEDDLRTNNANANANPVEPKTDDQTHVDWQAVLKKTD